MSINFTNYFLLYFYSNVFRIHGYNVKRTDALLHRIDEFSRSFITSLQLTYNLYLILPCLMCSFLFFRVISFPLLSFYELFILQSESERSVYRRCNHIFCKYYFT